jgi:hypothetical protein
MLCLIDGIRYDDPALQRSLNAVEEAHTLTERIGKSKKYESVLRCTLLVRQLTPA